MSAFQPIGNSITNAPLLTTNVNSPLGRVTGFGESIKIMNATTSDIAVRWGTGAQVAVTTDPTVRSLENRVFNVPAGVDNVATFARAAVGVGTIDIQCGTGGI